MVEFSTLEVEIEVSENVVSPEDATRLSGAQSNWQGARPATLDSRLRGSDDKGSCHYRFQHRRTETTNSGLKRTHDALIPINGKAEPWR